MASIQWIPTELDPRKMIAVPTLEAVRALLRAAAVRAPQRPSKSQPIEVRIDEHPTLTQTGGVARIDQGAAAPVAIARVGRTSFVAYRLEPTGLRELRVAVDATADTLTIEPDPPG